LHDSKNGLKKENIEQGIMKAEGTWSSCLLGDRHQSREAKESGNFIIRNSLFDIRYSWMFQGLWPSSASHNKVSVDAINAPNPVRHSGMLLAGIQPHGNPA
jgi:hypothetical protein